jgi:hypothetical protein
VKRFTETTKWDDPWFLDLTPEAKLVWLYLCDKCDNAGVIDLHIRKGEFETGISGSILHLLSELSTRVHVLENGKYWIKSFVSFQYGELKESSNLHKSVIQLLKNHGLPNPSDTLNEGFMKGPSKGKGKGTVKVEVDGKGKIEYSDKFVEFWKAYEIKGTKKKAFPEWNKLTDEEKKSAVEAIPSYIQENPERTYRKDAERYLRDKVFESVIERRDAGCLDIKSTGPLPHGSYVQPPKPGRGRPLTPEEIAEESTR